MRKVYKNHTVRLHGRVIDIPKRRDAARATYAGKEVVVKHLTNNSGDTFTEQLGGDIFTSL